MKNILLIAFSFLLLSCGARKMSKSSQSEEIKNEASVDSLAESTLQTNTENVVQINAVHEATESVIEYDGDAGDTITVTKLGPDGRIMSKTVISGKGKAKVGDVTSKSTSEENQKNHSATTATNKVELEKASKGSSKKEASAKQTDRKESYGGWMILLLVILLVLFYLNYQFKWISLGRKTMS